MSQQDHATHYILERIGDLSRRIEDALRVLERRTEQSARDREQLSGALRDIEELFHIVRGDGTDQPGLQTRFHEITKRLDSLEQHLDELDGTARLGKLEVMIEDLSIEIRQKNDAALKRENTVLLGRINVKVAVIGLIGLVASALIGGLVTVLMQHLIKP
jgi:chromosome segregation ATPase